MTFTKNSPLLKLIILGLLCLDIIAVGIILMIMNDLYQGTIVYILLYVGITNLLLLSVLIFNKKNFFSKVYIDSFGIVLKYKTYIFEKISWGDIDSINIKFNSYARFLVININGSSNQITFGISAKRLEKIKQLCTNPITLKMLNQIKISLFKFYIEQN